MADRIQMVTSSTAEYEQVQARLLETASRTYRPLAEAQELYIRTADSLKSLRYTTEQALDITDSFSFLLVTNAASADRAASAIDAYSKSIQTGKVSSDAWQSIMAAMPSLVNALAESTGKSTEIRKLGIEGSLSLRDLNEGLRKTVAATRRRTTRAPRSRTRWSASTTP
ncbi:tape measure protein [Pseudomonas aeruginosa]|uniref:tape measure protein n=1 Tax=Pseudomonas aeruginosa TaxID=287 RepID=UPI003D6F639D